MVVVLTAGLTGCATSGGGPSVGGGRIRVVAAESFWGSIAAQLGGIRAQVTSLVSNPDADPHDYEPTPQDARRLATARLVVENGIGYDGWAQKLLDANPVSGRVVLDVGKLLHAAAGTNPHQWYSQSAVGAFIDRATADLETLDPAGRSYYEARKLAYQSTGLAAYTALIARIKRRFAGTPIGASESIVAPLAASLGLKLVTPARFLDAIAQGNEPTASDKATADAQIHDHAIKVFVFNSQNSTPDVQRLVDDAHRARIPVTTVTETLAPADSTFQAWQGRQLRALLVALDASRAGSPGST